MSAGKNEKEKWYILKQHFGVDRLKGRGYKELKTWADMTWRNMIIDTMEKKGERIGGTITHWLDNILVGSVIPLYLRDHWSNQDEFGTDDYSNAIN